MLEDVGSALSESLDVALVLDENPLGFFDLSRWPTASQVSRLAGFLSFLSNVWEGGAMRNGMAKGD